VASAFVKKPRRQIASLSTLGATNLHLRSPYIISWWSAAFPGFGHLLLSKYLRGFTLILWEVFINTQTKVNMALVYSFTGQFERAKDVLEPRWMVLYAPVYIFSIFDSYRTTIDLNKSYILADRENAPLQTFVIGPLGINYLDKRRPWLAAVWSFLMPGMGQLYVHRIPNAFFLLSMWVLCIYKSKALLSTNFIMLNDFSNATHILDMHWLMFLPSICLFSVYDAYVSTVESNKLFDREQRRFLQENYQQYSITLPVDS
jgi:TM2 domain-containing membrane protein YozV